MVIMTKMSKLGLRGPFNGRILAEHARPCSGSPVSVNANSLKMESGGDLRS